jgi:hypothetical protein
MFDLNTIVRKVVEDYAVVGDTVVIEHDTTDRPLWQELVRLGVPREKIILTYTGEPVPDTQQE